MTSADYHLDQKHDRDGEPTEMAPRNDVLSSAFTRFGVRIKPSRVLYASALAVSILGAASVAIASPPPRNMDVSAFVPMGTF